MLQSPRPLREPLVQFLLLGGALFLLQHLLAPAALRPAPARTVVINDELVDGLLRDQQRQGAARPGAEAERALVERYLDDELRYREALALGLDRGDVVIRRRLVQKMELLAEAGAAAPTEAELAAYLQAHRERHRVPPRVSLQQVFLSRDRSPGEAELRARAQALRARLLDGADAESLGDPFLRGQRFTAQSAAELAEVFGVELARQVGALPLQRWSEPLASPYGLHLLRVTAHEPARDARVDEVRPALSAALTEERRAALRAADRERLRRRYTLDLTGLSAQHPRLRQALRGEAP